MQETWSLCQKLYSKESRRRSVKSHGRRLGANILMAIIEEHHEVFLNERNFEPLKTSPSEESMWYLDNGASNHMTGVKDHFKEIDEKITGNIQFGDGSYIEIKGKGFILLQCKNKEQRAISQVYYILNLKSNILSLGQLKENGCKLLMEKNILLLYDSNGNILLRVTRSKNKLYKANLRIGEPTCLLANLHDEAWLWHARLGHLNFRSLKSRTTKNLVQGIPSIKHSINICDICLIGKHARTPFPQQAKYRSKTALDLIYGDLCGPISPPTPLGKRGSDERPDQGNLLKLVKIISSDNKDVENVVLGKTIQNAKFTKYGGLFKLEKNGLVIIVGGRGKRVSRACVDASQVVRRLLL
nr:zinc finger, CCHC-type [Tanacetum cinerariifolium]